MPKEAMQQRENYQKNIKFLAFLIPLLCAWWICVNLFYFYLNPRDFSQLPQNIREEYLSSLFFYQDQWRFPITLTDFGQTIVPISLTDNVPLMVLLFKLTNVLNSQYFGLWFTLSMMLYTFFAYRICRYIFQKDNYILIGISTCLFFLLPFVWYQMIHVPWLAGQWVILWAYSLYFCKKSYIPREWMGVMFISALIHPFFTLICFFIMIADIFHLYFYNHSISSIQAAASFSYFFSVCFLTMGVLGTFYLPTYLSDVAIPALSFSEQVGYNISFFRLGYGIFFGMIFVLCWMIIAPAKFKQYIYYYRALVSGLILLAFFSVLGGITINDSTIIYLPSWISNYLGALFSSGPKFLASIMLLIPIILTSGIYKLEMYKKHLGMIFAIVIIVVQIGFPISIQNAPSSSFKALDTKAQEFLKDIAHIQWIFKDKVPTRPPLYEKIAYFSLNNDITINAAPVVRFPSGYTENLAIHQKQFFAQEFQINTAYIISNIDFPQEYKTQGDILSLEELTIFIPYNINFLSKK